MSAWFEAEFGFAERKGPRGMSSFRETQSNFTVSGCEHDTVLHCAPNNRTFRIGLFETLSPKKLKERLCGLDVVPPTATKGDREMALSFTNICGDVRSLIRDPGNGDAVFQVASQFNCLEMVGPSVPPEEGVTCYASDPTQGPACALACPAALVYRNYFAPDGKGQAGGRQINLMREVEQAVQNAVHKFWTMTNGYMIPTTPRSMAAFNAHTGITTDDGTWSVEALADIVQVGVHWSTEVSGKSKHCVAQVFTSAVPVAYTNSTRKEDWRPMAEVALLAAYRGTLGVAAVKSRMLQRRVPVFLTCVGGGAFGNMDAWICRRMVQAMLEYADEPLDVYLVHYGSITKGAYTDIPRMLNKQMGTFVRSKA